MSRIVLNLTSSCVVLLAMQAIIANKTGAHSKVPAWFDPENGYAKNELPGELYDLRADLTQKQNLYAAQPARVKELTTLLESCD